MNILKENFKPIAGSSIAWVLAIGGVIAEVQVWLGVLAISMAIAVSFFTIRKIICDIQKNKLEQKGIRLDNELKEQQLARELLKNKIIISEKPV